MQARRCNARASDSQGTTGVAGGAELRRVGACATGSGADLPGAEQGGARTPSVWAGGGASQRPSRLAETTGTSSTEGDVDGWRRLRRTRGVNRVFSQVASEMEGALRATRAVADAAVRRARRLFFRDEG